MKGAPIPWSAAELDWISDHRHLPRRELHRLFVARFGRADVSQVNLTALCKRRGWLTGRSGRFEPGQEPPNKGKPMPYHPNSAATRFKPGTRQGRANQLYQPIGTERTSKDGYIERKVNDDLPMQRRWRAVHLISWEAIHGPVPEGHALKCRDGNRTNTDPDNWLCVPRSMLPRLAGRWTLGYDEAPDELKPVVLATAQLDHAARQARKAGKS